MKRSSVSSVNITPEEALSQANHTLDTRRQWNAAVIKTPGIFGKNGAIVKQRSEHVFRYANTTHRYSTVKEGFLLACKRSIWKVFRCCRWANCNRQQFFVAFNQFAWLSRYLALVILGRDLWNPLSLLRTCHTLRQRLQHQVHQGS